MRYHPLWTLIENIHVGELAMQPVWHEACAGLRGRCPHSRDRGQ